jgi:hypothetical protein
MTLKVHRLGRMPVYTVGSAWFAQGWAAESFVNGCGSDGRSSLQAWSRRCLSDDDRDEVVKMNRRTARLAREFSSPDAAWGLEVTADAMEEGL